MARVQLQAQADEEEKRRIMLAAGGVLLAFVIVSMR